MRATVFSTFYTLITYPVSAASYHITQHVRTLYERYLAILNTEMENTLLRKTVHRLEGEQVELHTLRKEVERLRGILALTPKLPLKLKLAEVVALDMSLDRRAFWINIGSGDGVRPALAVIEHRGVIGQVIETTSHQSLVLTVRDPLFRLHVVNVRTEERGMVAGQDRKGLVLVRYLHRNTATLPGDLFVTSGLGGIFPSGLGVGRVEAVERPSAGLESKIWIRPLVNVNHVQEAFVVLGKKETP